MKQIRTTIEGPYEPNDNGALWLDTSNPDAPILKAFTNGKWQATIGGEKVTEIDSDSTDEEIPSAKAVNDRITVLADKVGVDLSKYEEYFTIEATVDDTTVYFYRSDYGQDRGDYTVEVSTDGGATWVSKTATLYGDDGTVIANLDAGDKVLIRGTNQMYGGHDDDEGMPVNFANFWADKPCYVYGNIMSLVGGNDFAGLTSMENRGFAFFFSDCDSNYDGSWVLSKDGVELLLPATALADYCYASMFNGCGSLTAAPKLPATALVDNCYSSMFSGCTGLTEAPALPATTLAQYCYNNMFYYCTSLTTAPELPAATLEERCYNNMFSGCSNLSYIKALFTTTPGNTTDSWVSGVNATGTFVKSTNATWNVRGHSGVPENWTIKKGESSGNVPVTTAPMGLTEAQKEQVKENIDTVRPIKMLALPTTGDGLDDIFGSGMTLSEIKAAAEGKRNAVIYPDEGIMWCMPILSAKYQDEYNWRIEFCFLEHNSVGTVDTAYGRNYYRDEGTLHIIDIEV